MRLNLDISKTIAVGVACIFLAQWGYGQGSKQSSATWQVPAEAAGTKNPYAKDAASIQKGSALYLQTCAICHGNKGKGDGIAAAGLPVLPADHTSAKVQNESDGALFWKLSTGRGNMPAYQAVLTDEQRWALVSYIRTLSKKKSTK